MNSEIPKKLRRGRIHACVTMGTEISSNFKIFAPALMHDCSVNLILIKFKSLSIVLFDFRRARHSISTVFPKI